MCKEKKNPLVSIRGQSFLEFLILLPIMIAFFWYSIHVFFTINKSIVAQKELRGHLFHKLFNHNNGPIFDDRADKGEENTGKRAAFFMYVGDEQSAAQKESDGKKGAPISTIGPSPSAQTRSIASDTEGTKERDTSIYSAYGICVTPVDQKGPCSL